MDNKALKLGNNAESQETLNSSLSGPETSKEVVEAKESIARNIDQTAEDSAEGQFSENNKKDSGRYTQAANDNAVKIEANVKTLPSVSVMKEQTIIAIEEELAKTQQEIKEALSSKVVPFELNEKVRRARFLNGLLGELKRAVKLAEDFVMNLWKQYVQERKG